MAECRDLEQLCTQYVDGEAPAEQRASVDAHIRQCPTCRARVDEERTARQVLAARREGLRSCAPERLRARCAAYCEASARATPSAPATSPAARRTWPARWALSLAATLLLAVGGLFLYSAVNEVEALAAQLALDHMKCAQFASTAQDPAAAAQAWAVANGWSIHVPASAPERNLEFVALRRCLVTDGRTAHMMYKWRGEPLSLFVVPDGPDGRRIDRSVDTLGHEAIMWSANDRTYVVLARGHPSDPEISPVVGYMKANVR